MSSINDIVIVGGGSSGWLTAAAFVNELPFANITLIDKEVSTPVSVGEATLLGFQNFLNNNCGFDPTEYLKELDVGLKGGILFPDWGYDGSRVWHPFWFPPVIDGWSNNKEKNLRESMLLYECSMKNMIDKERLGDSYALHIDCIKLIEYIQRKIHINLKKSEVKGIKRHRNGNISSLILEDGSKVYGDVFIDCTGFKSILKDRRDRVDLSNRLYVDTAIAGHVDYVYQKEFTPYVSCPAVDHGWIWKIPLRTKIGTGLVFNRNITDIEEAKEYFNTYWKGRTDELKVIDWTPYYDKNMWDGNVISIGLSGGFIEPLESTGLALIVEGIVMFTKLIKTGYYNEYDVDYFNKWMVFGFEQCIDFVNGHYSKSYKDTKFWQYVRDNYKSSETLDFYINNMKSDKKSLIEGKGYIFGGANWIYWLAQMGYDISPKPDDGFGGIPPSTELVNHLEFCNYYL